MNDKTNFSQAGEGGEENMYHTCDDKGRQTNTNQKSDSEISVQCSQKKLVMHKTVKRNRHVKIFNLQLFKLLKW